MSDKNTFIYKSIILLLAVSTVFTGCSKQQKTERSNEVVVYTYDSFAGEWGPGPILKEKFESLTGLKLTYVVCSSVKESLSRAVEENSNAQADVILGIDNNLVKEAEDSKIFEAYIPKDAKKLIDKELYTNLSPDFLLTPYDYSHFAMIFDTQSGLPAPESMADLTKDIYAKKIIIMDPRTSTPGLGFLSWTVSAFAYNEKGYTDFWRALKPNLLTVTPGWSSGWGMFMEGEAPLCISYVTSPAYNVEYENTDRYVALEFSDGHVMQIEGAALLKNAPNKKGGKEFIDFLISDEAQNELPLTQWMYPANKNASIPECFKKAAPIPAKTIPVNVNENKKAEQKIIEILNK